MAGSVTNWLMCPPRRPGGDGIELLPADRNGDGDRNVVQCLQFQRDEPVTSVVKSTSSLARS